MNFQILTRLMYLMSIVSITFVYMGLSVSLLAPRSPYEIMLCSAVSELEHSNRGGSAGQLQ